MTFWEQFVKEPRDSAKSIQNFGYHGNFEVPITYEILMAQARAAEEVLKRHTEINKDAPFIQERIGLPKSAD